MPLFRSVLVPVFLFLLLIPTSLLAQKKGWQDVVYLKNGSIIRGSLAQDTPAEVVKIETIGRNVFVFNKEEVDRVAREYSRQNFIYPYTRGYQNITEAGLSVGYRPRMNGWGGGRQVDVQLQTFNGYQFHPALAAGLTTSIDTYGPVTLWPVALGIRGDLTRTKIRPYYGLDAGYALDWLNNPNLGTNYDGGFMWSPTLGLKFNSQKTHALVLNLGYRNQWASSSRQDFDRTTTEKLHYKRVLFRIGMSF